MRARQEKDIGYVAHPQVGLLSATSMDDEALMYPPPLEAVRLRPTEAAALLIAERAAREQSKRKYGWLYSSRNIACLRWGASDGERQRWARASRRLRIWGLMQRQSGLVMALRGSLAITEAGRVYVAEHRAALKKLARRATAAVSREDRFAAARSLNNRSR